jgi:hypothetical protein
VLTAFSFSACSAGILRLSDLFVTCLYNWGI